MARSEYVRDRPRRPVYPGYRFPAEVIHHAVWLYCESVRVAWRA